MQLLKQSTAATLKLGPFVDDTDFKTAETGLTIAQGDIQISKNGAAYDQTSEASPTTTHDADGWYPIPLTTTDTNTLGRIDVQVSVSGALPVWWSGQVVTAEAYDTLCGTDQWSVDVSALATAADVAAVQADVTSILEDTGTTLPGLIGAISSGAGDTAVTSATLDDDGDTMVYLDGEGSGIGGASVTAYLTTDYAAGTFTAKGSCTTLDDGSWGPLMLDAGLQYTIQFEKDGEYGPDTTTVTVA